MSPAESIGRIPGVTEVWAGIVSDYLDLRVVSSVYVGAPVLRELGWNGVVVLSVAPAGTWPVMAPHLTRVWPEAAS